MKLFQLFWMVALLGWAGGVAEAKLKIVATTPSFADIARQIGQDKVEVRSVMMGPENVHNVLAKPPNMLALNKADLFVHGGLDSEPWRDNLLKGARNPNVLPEKPGNVDMSQGVELRDVPTGKIDRSMGDVHAYGNPHFQLSPANAQRMASTLVKAMAQVDPENGEFYRTNAIAFVKDVARLQKELREEFKPYQGLKVVTYHQGWDYFAAAFGLEVVGTVEPKPAITPSPGELRKLEELMKKQNIKVLIVETYNSYKQAKAVADAVGAQVVLLPDQVLGVPDVDTYQKLFAYDIHQIIAAAKAAGVEAKNGGEAKKE